MSHPHLTAVEAALSTLGSQADTIGRWGARLADVLRSGGRLLSCGNGGSAEQAQHLSAELVGRFDGERHPLSAISLATEAPTLTALGNDYGFEEVFARQVRAHGRPGDVLICLSTSGTSRNVIAAARAAGEVGAGAWALTGPAPNPLVAASEESVTVDASATATIQELHLIAIHMLCAAVDAAIGTARRTPT